MKRQAWLALAVIPMLVVTVLLAQDTGGDKNARAASGKKATRAVASAPKSDASIQMCIADRLAHSKLKDDGITATVSGGVATLTGATTVAGHKGTATQLARKCGATTVTNDIRTSRKGISPDSSGYNHNETLVADTDQQG